jgi:LCP family protein required for cell wall assembly
MSSIKEFFINLKTKFQGVKIRFPVYLTILFFSVLFILFSFFDVPKIIKRNEKNKASNNQETQTLLASSNIEGLSTEGSTSISGTGNFSSVLVVGIDSRNVEVRNGEFINTKPEGQAGTRNADTIMQVIFDHRDDKVFLISIPRDMGVDVREDCIKFSGSINQLYDKAQKKNCPGGGIGVMERTVSNITGIPINYHAFITLDVFMDIIKTVGIKDSKGNTGIVVENPRSFSDIYPASDGKGWENVYFPKGQLFLTPYRALQFARTRQYTGDFDRALRQQLIVESVAKSILNANTFLDPVKISSLIETYRNKTLISEPASLAELIQMIDIAGSADLDSISKFVLGPEFGGHEKYLDKQPHGRPGGPYYMVPTAWKECPGDEFCKVREYIKEIMVNPDLYINSDE